MNFFIKPKPPFSFDLVASLYSRFSVQSVDLYNEGIYERILDVGNKLYLVRIRSIGSVKKPKLSVEVLPDKITKEVKNFIKAKAKWTTGADEDIKEFYELAQKDKKFSEIIKSLYGLRAPKTPSVFEALIIAISEQQIALPVAISLRKKLAEKYGQSITIESRKYYSFPTSESLAKAKPEDIRKLGFSLKKSECIINVSKKIENKEINLELMKSWTVQDIFSVLIKIKGLGPWTIEYMMCRGMGRYDALPANDLGLRMAITEYLGKKERVSEQEIRNLLEPFGEHKGYAAFYLIHNYAFQKYSQEKFL